MDNVTHSLFGYALGRAFAGSRASAAPPEPLRRAFIATSVLASNVPDLDFIAGFFGGDRRLVYLLQHRGWSHTFLLAILLGALTGLGCAVALKLRAARERVQLAALGALACVLHVGCDFLNDYGVHPFSPFDDRWLYGDSVFIVEPLWIAVMLPLPALFGLSRWGRVLTRTLAVGLLALCGFVLSGWSTLAVAGAMVVCGLAQWRLGPRAFPVLAASAMLVAVFALGGQLAEAQVREALRRGVPSERVLDIASSPTPGDPTCHRVLVVTIDPRGVYRARLATSQLFAKAGACRLLPSEPTAPLRASDVPSTDRVQLASVFAAPASELRALVEQHCDARALMHFLRVPFWLRQGDGTILGDLRYDRAPGIEFAERKLNDACVGTARWRPPRSDLWK